MKEFLKNIKKGLTITLGMFIGFVILGIIYVFAVSLTATDGETLTASKWNSLVAKFSNCTTLKYSTSEVLTGERWIDGKPIYTKIYNGTSLVSNGSSSVINVLGNVPTNFESLVKISGSTISPSSYGNIIPLPYDNTLGQSIGQFLMRSPTDPVYPGKFTCRVGAWPVGNRGAYNVVVYYTKSTDTSLSLVANICD